MDKHLAEPISFNLAAADAAAIKDLLQTTDKNLRDALLAAARAAALRPFGHNIYISGLIEWRN